MNAKRFDNIIIFGAGGIGKDIYQFLKKNEANVVAIIDGDEKKQGEFIDNIKIQSLLRIKSLNKDEIILIASNIYSNYNGTMN